MPARRRVDYAPNRHRVVDDLRKLCLEASASGLPLPSESELAARLGVGRATLRDALTRLETEGLILRRKGADTLVNAAALDLSARIDLQVDFSEILRDAGFDARVVLIESGPAPLDEAPAAGLGLASGSPAFRTVKKWDADGKPVMVAVDWIPLEEERDVSDPSRSVFALATEVSGSEISWEVACPGAVAVTGEIAGWLDLEEGAPVWTLERVGIDRTGRRCFFALEYHLPSVVRYGFVRSVQRP